MQTCIYENCEKPPKTRSYCMNHYMKLRRDGMLSPVYAKRGEIKVADNPLYPLFKAMHQRCENEKNKSYKRYGGRGIGVCERWANNMLGFTNFTADMGKRPNAEYSLDRIDNNKGYSPDNCRWASTQTQMLNRGLSKRNRSGYTGLYQDPRTGIWSVTFGKKILIRTRSKAKAISVRKNASRAYFDKLNALVVKTR